MPRNNLLTVAQAATILNCSGDRVRDFIREGRLKAQVLGDRFYVISRAEVERFARIPRPAGGRRRPGD